MMTIDIIAFIGAIIIAANADKLLAGGLVIALAVMLRNICGLGLGHVIGRGAAVANIGDVAPSYQR